MLVFFTKAQMKQNSCLENIMFSKSSKRISCNLKACKELNLFYKLIYIIIVSQQSNFFIISFKF